MFLQNIAPAIATRSALLLCLLVFCSCGDPDPSRAPVIHTEPGGKVDLSKVSLELANVRIDKINDNQYVLSFDYSLINNAGGNIVFPCLHNNTDSLLDVQLSDKEDLPLVLGKRPLDGLTLAEPRPLRIPIGTSTRSYKVPVMPELREQGDPIRLRVRLHAPSRYDELRSTIEAPPTLTSWPG